jgi:carboxylate-amine ligase
MAVIEWLQNVFEGKRKLSEEGRFYKKIDEQLVFATSRPLTVGVECELALLDAKTLRPAHMGLALIEELASLRIKKESFEHMVEVTSTISATVHETATQLKQEMEKLAVACERHGLLITGTGRPPTIRLADIRQVPDERYERLRNERKILTERFGTLGMHVHLGMPDAEQCVRYHNFFMHFVPHLIALSASSPFEEGVDTGLVSIRHTITESLPIAGMPYNFKNWQEYVNLCRAMYRAGSIERLKDLWWDVRSCPQYGTLEIRVCDQPASMAEVLALAAFVHALAFWFQEDQDWLSEMPRPNAWTLRENKWRAMRYGLNAELVINNLGETRPIGDDIKLWLERIRPHAKKHGYLGYTATLEEIMSRGNSADRQRRLWSRTQDLEAVAKFNCDEFAAQRPLWERVEDSGNDNDKEPVAQPRALGS